MSRKFIREEADRFHDYNLYIPSRTIYMGSETYGDDDESGVDGAMVARAIKNLAILDSLAEEPITVILNSPGGDYYHGMAIYDAVKACRNKVGIKVFGSSMSMGALILQAADKRILSKNSKVMIHYGYSGLAENHTRTNEKWIEEIKKTNDTYEEILLEKIRDKHTDFPRKKLQKMLDFDTILSAREAVDLGLADSILGEEGNG